MIPKPEQEDKQPTIEYVRNVSKQVIQARKDINAALQNSADEEIDKIAFDERDRIADAFVKLLEAWQYVSDGNFPKAIGEVAIAEEVATKSSLHVWDELAASVYDDAVRALGNKIITVADLTEAVQLKINGEKARRSAVILYEQDDYAAIEKYREAVELLKKSKEQAELATFSVRGQTLQAWVKIALYLLTLIVMIVGLVISVRGCAPESKQIPSSTTVSSETNESNLTK